MDSLIKLHPDMAMQLVLCCCFRSLKTCAMCRLDVIERMVCRMCFCCCRKLVVLPNHALQSESYISGTSQVLHVTHTFAKRVSSWSLYSTSFVACALLNCCVTANVITSLCTLISEGSDVCSPVSSIVIDLDDHVHIHESAFQVRTLLSTLIGRCFRKRRAPQCLGVGFTRLGVTC